MTKQDEFYEDKNKDGTPDGLEFLSRDENKDNRPDILEPYLKSLELRFFLSWLLTIIVGIILIGLLADFLVRILGLH